MKPKLGFVAATVRHFYTDLSKVKHDDQQLVEALKCTRSCHEKYTAFFIRIIKLCLNLVILSQTWWFKFEWLLTNS